MTDEAAGGAGENRAGGIPAKRANDGAAASAPVDTAPSGHKVAPTVLPNGPLTLTVWVVAALFYAVLIWQGVSELTFPGSSLIAVRDANLGVFLLVAFGAILVPVILALGAVWLGRTRKVGIRALLLLAGLAASATVMASVWSLGLLAL